MKSSELLFLLSIVLVCVSLCAGRDEKEKESFYAQLSRAIIRLEHFEKTQRKKSAQILVKNVSDGTAFFIGSVNSLYVVTARHVVEKPYDLHARVQCRNRKTLKNEVFLLELPRHKWVYHNNIGDEDTRFVDVAVMKIPLIKEHSINCFRYELKDSNDYDKNQLPLGDPEPPQPILVFGFPRKIGFTLLEQIPIGRSGIISMRTGKKFLKIDSNKFVEERCCIIDASMFPGNSGSPVMNQQRIFDLKPRLLGLVIAANDKLDFGIIEPVSRIRETLDLARDKSVSGHWKLILKTKVNPVHETDTNK